MKYIFLFLLILSSSGASGQYYRGEFSLEEISLREEGDSVRIQLIIRNQAAAVERRKGIRFIPSLEDGTHSIYLPDIVVEGTNKKAVRNRWRQTRNSRFPSHPPHVSFTSNKYSNDRYQYTIKVPFQEWMDSARFVLYQELVGYSDKRGLLAIHTSSVIEREELVPYLVKPHVVYIEPERDDKRRKRQGRAYLNFQAGRSVILPNFRNNPEELSKVQEAIQDLRWNKDVEIHKIYIEGYASPEGSYATNERLSRERAVAFKDYLRQYFNFSESLFQVSSIAEDWDGVLEAVRSSTLGEKERVIGIIETVGGFDQREAALKGLGGGLWLRMLNDLFPPLRRVEYQIDYSVREYSLEESDSLLRQNPENLSQRELFLLARHYGEKSPEYSSILLETIPRLYPDDEISNNNTAALLMEQGEYTSALRYIEKAGDSPAARNNRGVLYLLTDRIEEAKVLFESAKNSGLSSADKNLEEAKIKEADNEWLQKRNRKK